METDSTENAPFRPPKIYLSSSLPGSSVPIRAPLTIDSDSEFCYNDQIYSRTSSFNSTSSIDISSYGDEHTSVHDEEDDTFLANPNEEIITETCRIKEYSFPTPFVKYRDGNHVKERSNSEESAVFRPLVKTSCEESSSVADFGIKSGAPAPVAPLTSDCDSDIDSVESHRWLDSSEIPVHEIVENVTVSPKVRIYSDDEVATESQFEGMFSDDRTSSVHELSDAMKDSVLAESIEDDEHKIDSLNVLDSQRIDVDVLTNSDVDIKIETVSDYNNDFERALSEKEEETHVEIHELSDAMKDSILAKSIEDDEHKIDHLNVVNSQSSDVENFTNSDVEIKIETISDYENDFKKAPSEKEEETHVEIHELSNAMQDSILAESIEDDEHKVDCLNVLDSQRIDVEVFTNSDIEIKIETISDYKNDFEKAPSEKEEETQVEIQPIKSKLVNLIRLLGLSNQDSTIVQLLDKLALGNNEFDSNLTILVIGKTGVGKTATINSIFGETKVMTDSFGPGTAFVQEIVGNVDGVHLRIIDTPGLRCCSSDRFYNLRILSNIKRLIQKHTPDVVLYVDRLDMYTQDVNDLNLLRLITGSLGSSMWRNCIIALTHAGSDDHVPLEEFVLRRCRFIQQQIVRFGGGDLGTANLVWLVENHPGYKQDMSWRNRLVSNDDVCDNVMPFEPLNELFVEYRKGYFNVDGYCVKLLGTKHWSLACRVFS